MGKKSKTPSKVAKKKSLEQNQTNLNLEAIDSLSRLSIALRNLNEKDNADITTNSVDDDSEKSKIVLGHWREIPNDVTEAYQMLNNGAEIVKATSTKYTLLGKINVDDGSKLAQELRQGCELIATASLIIHQPSSGCARSTRKFMKQHSRSIIATVLSLVQSFASLEAVQENQNEKGKPNIGSQKTGAVWSACDAALTKLPRGNRACMRRELFTWVGDCNETMEEFQESLDLGRSNSDDNGADSGSSDNVQEGTDETWDDFCENKGTGEQYSAIETQIIVSCLALLKCSRGVLGLVIKACECAGGQSSSSLDQNDGNTNSALQTSTEGVLKWINNCHDLARNVGEGVTDTGVLLYPPLDLIGSKMKSWDETNLGKQINIQKEYLMMILDNIINPAVQNQDGENHGKIIMSEEVLEMANKLQNAINVRCVEIQSAITLAL